MDNEHQDQVSEAALSRRRLLQAGAATGIAAAVWSTPRIVAAQNTPGDGAVCTVAPLKYSSTASKNFNNTANCTVGGVTYMTFHSSKGEFDGGDWVITFGPPVVGDPGCTAPQAAPNQDKGTPYAITFDKGKGPGDGYVCYIGKLKVWNQSSGASYWIEDIFSGYTPVIPKTSAEALLGSQGSYFYGDITLECCPAASYH